MPKLSFVVPIYKPRREVLAKSLKSIATQSLRDIEVICVLDGPSSDARAVIQNQFMGASFPWSIKEIEHGGACKARNEGFNHSTGDYVVCWDSDCVIEPDTAKTWVEVLDRSPDIGFVYSSYKFSGEMGAINSEPFDPWLLRVRNYISSCFPVRRELFPGWNEGLKSLQDWDFWLSVVEKGGKGKFLKGYAFTTEYPTAESISGKGCTPEVWLERVDAVKKIHGLPERDVCVSAMQYKSDGIRLAKLIDADYQDLPTEKPHKYKTIIQIGFSMASGSVQYHSSVFNDPTTKKVLFWTGDNIAEMYSRVSFLAIDKYSTLLNSSVKQYCEDKNAEKMLKRAGFNVEIMPIPFKPEGEPSALPEKPRFALDVCGEYAPVFDALKKALPDIEIESLEAAPVDRYTGVIHFYLDRSMSTTIKHAILEGRHVISNVQAPFAGYVDDAVSADKFLPEMVNKVRELAYSPANPTARDYYLKQFGPENLLEAIKA